MHAPVALVEQGGYVTIKSWRDLMRGLRVIHALQWSEYPYEWNTGDCYYFGAMIYLEPPNGAIHSDKNSMRSLTMWYYNGFSVYLFSPSYHIEQCHKPKRMHLWEPAVCWVSCRVITDLQKWDFDSPSYPEYSVRMNDLASENTRMHNITA